MSSAAAPPAGTGPGTRGNLSSTQSKALFRLWQRFFRLCQTPALQPAVSAPTHAAGSASAASSLPNSALASLDSSAPNSAGASHEALPGHDALHAAQAAQAQAGQGHAKSASTASNQTTAQAQAQAMARAQGLPEARGADLGKAIPKDDGVKDELKTLEEAKEMRTFLDKYGGERLRQVFWEMVKGEHPDALMLRFLRARKWDVDRAIALIGSIAAFRIDMDIEGIVRGGEVELAKTRGGRNILANGISYAYGASYQGEPVHYIDVARHFSHNQTQGELKRGVILLQEWLRMMMPPPVEQQIVIFNLKGFGLRNMDWWSVFFMVKTMESYYVESLGRVYVHCPPWIFRPIWAILRPLLDPVVRDKVRLTSTPEELAEHIPFDHLPEHSMGGGLDWGFVWPELDPNENDIQKDTETRDKLRAEYSAVAVEFERATRRIVRRYAARAERSVASAVGGGLESSSSATASTSDSASDSSMGDIAADLKAQRDVLATKLRVAWLRLVPYVVGKTMFNRWNVVRADGSVCWQYPVRGGEHEEQVLGEGTSLTALESALRQIEEANRELEQLATPGKEGFGSPATTTATLRSEKAAQQQPQPHIVDVPDEALGLEAGAPAEDVAVEQEANGHSNGAAQHPQEEEAQEVEAGPLPVHPLTASKLKDSSEPEAADPPAPAP